jgi:ribose transport system substrate-binding protein
MQPTRLSNVIASGLATGCLVLAMAGCGKSNRNTTADTTPRENPGRERAITAAKPITVGVSIPTADHGWTGGVVWWAKKAIEDWKGKDANVKFILSTAKNPADQVDQIENLMVRGIDALVILPHDSAPLTPICGKVKEKNILLVVVDRGLTKPYEDIYIAGDNPGFGRASAEFMAAAMKGKGKIVILEGIPCVINKERVDGFKEVMKTYPDIEILDSQPAYWSTQKGLEIMENFLQKYNKIDAVWAGDDDVLKGVLQAYKESGRKDIRIFVGGAGSKEIIKRVMNKDPLIPADITYSPNMVATAISTAVLSLRETPLNGFYQKKIPSRIILRSELVTPENAAAYYVPEAVY